MTFEIHAIIMGLLALVVPVGAFRQFQVKKAQRLWYSSPFVQIRPGGSAVSDLARTVRPCAHLLI